MLNKNSGPFKLRIDPSITTADQRVVPEEWFGFGNIPDDRPTGEGITVAVRDTGIDDSHPALADANIEFVDFTESGRGDQVGHGTATAWCVHKVAPDAKIVALRIFGGSGQADPQAIYDSYKWLLSNGNDIDIVNDSWGSSGRVRQLDKLHTKLHDEGIRDVTAAGNSGDRGGSPATAENAWGVGALRYPSGKPTNFSDYNPNRDNPDTSQAGKNILLPRANGTSMGRVVEDYEWPAVVASGTSFAAPIQAGMAAAWAEEYGAPLAAMSAFEETAADVPGTPRDGEGRAVLEEALQESADDFKNILNATVWAVDMPPFVGDDFIRVKANALESGDYEVALEDLKEVFKKK